MNGYFKKEERIARLWMKWEKQLEKKSGRIITFFFAIFCYLPILPDIIWTRILYKKIKFPYFIIASIIGKWVTHIPFIFLGKTIVELLGI
jgi:membrane protein YqaA with SNARE-associated domain